MQNIFTLITLIASLVTLLVVLLIMMRMAASNRALEREFREELQRNREESLHAARELREELAGGMRSANESTYKAFEAMGRSIKDLTESNQQGLERIRGTFDQRIRELAEGNEKKLDEMRKTVDEKLHDTLEKRLGESFKLVSERLEAVQRGLGEMQSLASGVTDLRKVLSNVKTRGIWAEVQLGAILEQILNADQYEKNVAVVPQSSERVEFAVKLPGPRDDRKSCVWLPIDSKFPQEDYLRLIEASERGDSAAVASAVDSLARTVRLAAKEIHDKYISPPYTTDFAIMFLGTEGLYAEVLRNTALTDELSRKYRIVTAGPTTLAAILSSLRMGFQTLAIEQRAAEVWRILAAIKTEFAKFGDILDRVQKQLETASRTIEQTGKRSRIMERKLRSVESLPEEEAGSVLGLNELSLNLTESDADSDIAEA